MLSPRTIKSMRPRSVPWPEAAPRPHPIASSRRCSRPGCETRPTNAPALRVALALENEASSTYLFALGSLEATAALQLAASILPVESQHTVVLAALVADAPRQTFPAFETQDRALKPDEFPAPS